MNAKLCKRVRKLLQLRTAPPTEYLQHERRRQIIVNPDSPQGTYKRIKKARFSSAKIHELLWSA